MFYLNERFDKKTYNSVNFGLFITITLLIATCVISALCALYPNLFHNINLFVKNKITYGVWACSKPQVDQLLSINPKEIQFSFWGYLVIILFGLSTIVNFIFLICFCKSKKIVYHEKNIILFILLLFNFLNLLICEMSFIGTINFELKIPGYKKTISILYVSNIISNFVFPTLKKSTTGPQATWIWIILLAFVGISILSYAIGCLRILKINFSNSYKKMKKIETTTYAL